MFTDMVGYQDALRQDESLAKHLLDKQRSIIREALSTHRGRDIGGNLAAAEETGLKSWIKGPGGKTQTKLQSSECLVLFESPLDATRCAVEIQRMLREYNREAPSNKDVYVRIGIHVGDVTEREGEVSGEAVAVASRVAPVAEPGGICVSEKVYRNVRDKFEFPIIRLGRQELKNTELSIEVYRLTLPWEKQAPGEPTTFDPHRLAVLPLANISADPNDEYFADGMTEELISTLSRISGLRVIARTSAMHYKGSGKRISEIGRELRVGSLLEGSVRKAGDKMRISVQLIDSSNEEHLWADDYDRKIEDVFEIQRNIARSVADGLRVKLFSSDHNRLDKKETQNSAAFTLSLKGRHYWNERTKEGLNKALEYFEKAIEQDPGYARAYSGLADTYYILAFQGYIPSAEALPKAKAWTEKALELDSGLAEAHTSLGFLHEKRYNWTEAEKEYKLATELNPSYATAHFWYSILLTWLRRNEEAIEEAKKAEELDPFSPIIMAAVGQALAYARHYDEAIQKLQRMIEVNPDVHPPHFMLGLTYLYKGLNELAIEEIRKVISITGEGDWYESIVRIAEARLGRTEGARELIRLLEPKPGISWDLALLYASLGEDERAIQYLEKCYEEQTFGLGWFTVMPTLDELRGNPRYISLLAKMNLANAQREIKYPGTAKDP